MKEVREKELVSKPGLQWKIENRTTWESLRKLKQAMVSQRTESCFFTVGKRDWLQEIYWEYYFENRLINQLNLFCIKRHL